MQQILYRAFVGEPVLWLAGAEPRDAFRRIAHCALFSLELWGLSVPNDAAFMDGRSVFSDLLYL